MDLSMLLIASPFLAGGVGALVSDITADGELQLPRICGGKFYAGFIGRVMLGSVAGLASGSDPLLAFSLGYVGSDVMPVLVSKYDTLKKTALVAAGSGSGSASVSSSCTAQSSKQDLRSMIEEQAALFGVAPALAVAVAECESSLDPLATNKNSDGSIDRGLFQWNSKYHPEITDAVAFDPVACTAAACRALRDGNQSWWNASKSCWSAKIG